MTFLTDLAEFGSAIAGIINGTKAKKWGRYRSWLLQEQPGIISEFFYGIVFALVPAILCAAGALLLIFGFKITKEKVEKYQAEIDARA